MKKRPLSVVPNLNVLPLPAPEEVAAPGTEHLIIDNPSNVAKILADLARHRRAKPIELPDEDTLRIARLQATVKHEEDPKKKAFGRLALSILSGNVEYDAENPMLIEDLAQVPEVIDAARNDGTTFVDHGQNS